jgi:HK97 gp10 family phage protein
MPVVKGWAQESIDTTRPVTKRTARGGTSQEVQAGGGKAFYVKWLEEGNSRQDAQPVVRPAAERARVHMPRTTARLLAIEIVKATRHD